MRNRFHDWLYWAAKTMLVVMVVVSAFIPKARADTVLFGCRTEHAANLIAEAVADSDIKVDNTADPFLRSGECRYFEQALFVYVVYRGMTYTGAARMVTVVGVSHTANGTFPEFFGFIETKDLLGDGSI